MRSLVKLGIFILCLLSVNVYAVTFEISPNATAIPGAIFSFQVIVRGIAVQEIKDGSQTTIKEEDRYLDVIFPKSDTSKPILPKTPSSQADITFNNKYYFTFTNTPVISTNTADSTQLDITFQIDVRPKDSTVLLADLVEKEGDASVIKATVEFRHYVSEGSSTKSFDTKATSNKSFQITYAKPNEAPKDLATKPTHKAFNVSWTSGVAVPFTDPTITSIPSEVVAYIVRNNVGPIDLEAYIIDQVKGEHEKTGCRLEVANGTTCTVTCDAEGEGKAVFLAQTQAEIDGLAVVKGANNGLITYTPKDLKADYLVFLQYIDGAKRSACVTAAVGEDISFAEYNGAPEAEQGDLRCFIASAAYGSPFSRHVDIFRWARDRFLLKTAIGRDFVKFYYNNSPPLAEIIHEHKSLQYLFRALLFVPALSLYTLREGVSHPLLAAFVLLACCGGVYVLRRRRSFFP